MPKNNKVGAAIRKIGPESEPILRNLLDLYVQDMSEWFEIKNSYDMSLVWREGQQAYLASVGTSVAGFALVGPAAKWLGAASAHDVHEFFVLREFRRSGVGRHMAAQLWNERPGEWLVRVVEDNAPALGFWRATISNYSRASFREETVMIDGRPWRFFRFQSNSA